MLLNTDRRYDMKRSICYAEKVLILLKYCCLVVLSVFSNTNEKNCILMDLTDMPINRRTVQIFLQLRQTGYQVYFRFFPRQFVNGYYYRKTAEENSFSYYGLEMLASVLQNLLDFGVDRVEIERKREYIRQNYIKNLSFQSFYDKLEAFIASGRREEIYYLSER